MRPSSCQPYNYTGDNPSESDGCPQCGDPIQYTVARGPGDVRAQPCGCRIGHATGAPENERVRTDGSGTPVRTSTAAERTGTDSTAVYVHRATSGSKVSDYIYVSFAADGIYQLDAPAGMGSIEEWVERKVTHTFDGDHGEERLDDLVPAERDRTGPPIEVGTLYFNRVTHEASALELDEDAFDDGSADATDDGLRADGGQAQTLQEWHALTGFRRDILRSVLRIDDTDQDTYGLAIKRDLESRYGEEINHGRLYPNLNTLVEDDFLEKTRLDNRTNEYALTPSARDLLDAALTEDAHLVDSTYYAEPVTEYTPARGDD